MKNTTILCDNPALLIVGMLGSVVVALIISYWIGYLVVTGFNGLFGTGSVHPIPMLGVGAGVLLISHKLVHQWCKED